MLRKRWRVDCIVDSEVEGRTKPGGGPGLHALVHARLPFAPSPHAHTPCPPLPLPFPFQQVLGTANDFHISRAENAAARKALQALDTGDLCLYD